MNRTKIIYFLSAIVLIIGCYTLNLSYSLFVSTVESAPIETTIPKIDVVLSSNTIDIEPGEYLIKQTITNSGTIPVNFALSANYNSEKINITATTDNEHTYLSKGTINTDESKNIYLKVTNRGEETVTVNFTIDKNYTTIVELPESKNINNENIYNIEYKKDGLPYEDNMERLNYKIIKNQVDKFGSKGIEVSGEQKLDDLFTTSNIMPLPLTSAGIELDVPNFKEIEINSSSNSHEGLYKAEDDYGTSYIYRGINDYNYVKFAGFIWRIVRINGDGSLRLILDNSINTSINENELDYIYKNETLKSIDDDGLLQFNINNNDNAYVGYMYGEFKDNSTSYDEAHSNKKDSDIKKYIDKFYEQYLNNYANYLSDSIFCGDKSLSKENNAKGIGIEETLYASYDRLSSNTVLKPTLECAVKNDSELSEEQLAYSRYTSVIDSSNQTNKGVLVNNDLTYPIGLLSADELVMAGAYNNDNLGKFYLYNEESDGWWTMTAHSYKNNYAYSKTSSLNFQNIDNSLNINYNNVRPVINLKSDIIVISGDGTKDTTVGEGPYIVSIPE